MNYVKVNNLRKKEEEVIKEMKVKTYMTKNFDK